MSQDYNEAIQTPRLCFRDEELRQAQPALNPLGLPLPRSGNFADVYELGGGGRKWAVKCFTRQVPGLAQRYQVLSGYLRKRQLPFLVNFSFLEPGIKVRGHWYPILKMDWVEGLSLNTFVQQHLDKPQLLQKLLEIWLKLAAGLRAAQIAHGDLQHGNVLLVPATREGSVAVRLVDYDGMWVPPLAGQPSAEAGHPAYQHPVRQQGGVWNLHLDRCAHLVIYTALRALVASGRALWDKYDNSDNLLFRQRDLEQPARSPLFQELLSGQDPEVRRLADALRQAVQRPPDRTPLLDEFRTGEQAVAMTSSRSRGIVSTRTAVARTRSSFVRHLAGRWRTGGRRPWVGGVVAGVLLLAGLLLGGTLWVHRRSSGTDVAGVETAQDQLLATPASARSPLEGAEPTPTADLPRTVSPPAAKIASPPPADPEPKHVVRDGSVDLLALIDPAKHAVRGAWRRQDGALSADTDALLHIPYVPPAEYDFRIDFARQGGNAPVRQFLSRGDRTFAWVMGAEANSLFSFDRLRGVSGLANPSAVQLPAGLENGKRYTAVVKVRRNRVLAFLDGQLVTEWRTAFDDLADDTLWDLPRDLRLGLGTSLGPTIFYRIELRVSSADSRRTAFPAKLPVRTLGITGSAVTGVAVAADGRQAASAHADRTLRLWDLASGREVQRLRGHAAEVVALAFTQDGQYLLSGSLDKTIRGWDVVTGREQAPIPLPMSDLTTLAFAPGAGVCLCGTRSGGLRHWDVKQRQYLHPFGGHDDRVNAIAWSPDGRWALTAAGARPGAAKQDDSVRVWEVARGQELRRLTGLSSVGLHLAWAPDGKRALAVGANHTVWLWSLATGQELQQLAVPGAHCAAFSADGRLVLVGAEKELVLWDAEAGEERARLGGPTATVRCLAVAADGTFALSGDQDGRLRVWSLPPPEALPQLSPPASVAPVAHPVSPKAPMRVVGVWDHQATPGPRVRLRLLANGRINEATSPSTWTLQGTTLILRWPNKAAPGGVWIDTCTVAGDGKSYAGRNQVNAQVRGTRVGD